MVFSTEQLLYHQKRLYSKIVFVTEGGCWMMSPNRSSYYPRFSLQTPIQKKSSWYAHRASWILAHNQYIPDRLMILHRCDNGLCINPDHLNLGTAKQNAQERTARGRGGRLTTKFTHCRRGHERSPENLYIWTPKPGMKCSREQSFCRICIKLRSGSGGATLKERFDAKWQLSNDGCWVWTGGTGPSGYGQFTINQKNMGAHRAAWILYKGEIPTKMVISHICDKPLCVNPDHLQLMTQAENMADMARKGRAGNGFRSGTSWDNSLLVSFRERN